MQSAGLRRRIWRPLPAATRLCGDSRWPAWRGSINRALPEGGCVQDLASDALVLRLLGGMELTRGRHALAASLRAKARGLLAYLAVTGRAHSRETLSGLLWCELSGSNARNNLRVALASLNRELDGCLDVDRIFIGLRAAAKVWQDVEEFLGNLNRGHEPAGQPDADRT